MKRILLSLLFLLSLLSLSNSAWAYNWSSDSNARGVWLFENTNSPTPDSTSNGNDGTLSSMTHATTTPPDSDDGFDGTSTGYYTWNGTTSNINVGSDSSLDALSSITYVLWGKFSSPEGGGVGYIFEKSNSDTSGTRFRYNANDGGGTGSYTTEFRVDGSSDMSRYGAVDSFVGSTWYHFALTWDGTITDATTATLYVNGEEIGYRTTTNGASRLDDSGNDMILGQKGDGDRTVSGDMDEMAVFETVLDGTDINDIMTNGLVQASATDTIYGATLYGYTN